MENVLFFAYDVMCRFCDSGHVLIVFSLINDFPESSAAWGAYARRSFDALSAQAQPNDVLAAVASAAEIFEKVLSVVC